MASRIDGHAGSLPQGPAPQTPPSAQGSAHGGRTGVLQIDGDRVVVDVDGERIVLDQPSTAAVLGRGGFVPPAKRRRREVPPELGRAVEAAQANRQKLEAVPGVVSVRGGYKFVDGRITKIPAVVLAVSRPVDANSLPNIGFEVEIAPADRYDLLEAAARGRGTEGAAVLAVARPLFIDEVQMEASEVLERARVITYRPPMGASLPEVTEPMTVVCHVSPDAGWRVLRPFISATRTRFVLGMYDFTAPHIYSATRLLLHGSGVHWTMTLGPNESLPGEDDTDSTKADDKTEASINRGLKRAAGARFQTAFARVGSGQTFASAYHIKVGVRDQSAFWLSSGNWQSSNQPDIDFLADDVDRQEMRRYNREWHVVVENETLSKIFQTYLEADFQTASSEVEAAFIEARRTLPELFVPEAALEVEERLAPRNLQVFAPKRFAQDPSRPLKVQPILTPDNYLPIVRALLAERPKHRLYFQNQSLNPIKEPTEEFDELMQRLIDYSNDPQLDVRIIFRNIGPIRKKLESLQAAGFNVDRIRMQAGCHTKGIVIDSRVVLVGSHNFTNDGVQFNRDASLLIHDESIAAYYEDVFLHDWERLARPTLGQETHPLLAHGQESTPMGYVRVPWSFYDDDN